MRINLGALLERQAARHGPRPFVTQAETGRTLTYSQFNTLANNIAHGLAGIGIAAGDPVAIMLSNSIEFLASSYALKKIGAVEVAVNGSFRGVSLERMINVTQCATIITSAIYVEHIADIASQLDRLRRAILVDGLDAAAGALPQLETLGLDDILGSDGSDFAPAMGDDEIAVILFTSGTTGVSKGCAIPHRSSVRAAESMIEAFDLTDRDCVYSPYPLFHVGAAQYDVLPAMMVGGRAVIRDRFSVSAFWPDVARHGATWFMALGSVQQLLWAAPPCPEETRHKLRFFWGTPLPVDPEAFEARFGVRVVRGGGYGSTDAGSVALPLFDKPGAGKVLDRYEVAIVDGADDKLPVGQVGELVIRPNEPAIMAAYYVGMPEETVKAWRNLWFHTGDLARLDDVGDLHFVARIAERIRVKGEMISAYEVEEVLLSHHAVEDCGVIGIPDGTGEETVTAFVTLRQGARVSPEELAAFCGPRMSRYMVPAAVEICRELPRTPTGKVSKAELRKLALGG